MTEPSEIRSDRVAVDVEYDAHVNFALQQNSVPLVKALRVRNLGAEALLDLEVALHATPELSTPLALPIGRIAPHGSHRFDAIHVPLSPTRLVNQNERERGRLWIEVKHGDEILLRTARDLDVLAYGEWPGPSSLPEILAAFVLPNHPEVAAVLAQAGRLLEERTGDPSIDGYERHDPARIRQVIQAIHDAVAALDLTYVLPPSSFEADGQKIRTPEQVAASRMGTCLDLTVFFAGILEQAGLHPLVVLFEDHAFAGVWLEEECFIDPAVDEILRIRKRVDLDSIVLFETTGVTARPKLGYGEAVAQASERIQSTENFLYAVDVRSARRSGIRPLPARRQEAYEVVDEAGGVLLDEVEPVETIPTGPQPRVERWKHKLLDLSLRNRLLNHKATKKTVRLDCPDLARLEDRLAEGKAFRLLPEAREAAEPQALIEELDRGGLRTDLAEEDLERRLVHIYRAARLSLQEGGANTLYMAVGFLRWFETPTGTTERLAPILLYPLTMTRRSLAEGTKGYRIELADDDPQINVTLLQKLEADYEVRVPGLEELDTDENGLDVTRILDRFRRAIRPMDRWEVAEDAAIGLFSFTKYLMWLDLDRRTDQLTKNDVVKHLLETPDIPYEADVAFPDPSTLDEARAPEETFVPMPADSSQQTAIFAAADGHTFVLEGPPGTGKSQTISNLICHSLATGKRVLFVSEKIAALNVVHKRLSRVGLAPFCLEIHSNKARKRAVLEQLREALDVAGTQAPQAWPRVAERLAAVRGDVNGHTKALHETRSFGKTAFDGLACLVRRRGAERLRLDFGAPDAVDAEGLERLEDRIHEAEIALDEVGDVRDHAWAASGLVEWSPSLPARVEEIAPALADAAEIVEKTTVELAADLAIDGTGLSKEEGAALLEAVDLLRETMSPPEGLMTEPAFEPVRERIEGWIRTGQAMRERAAALGDRWNEGLLDLDLLDIRARLEAAGDTFWPLSWWRARRPKKQLRPLYEGKLPKTKALIPDIDQAIDWRQRREELKACEAEGRERLGAHWRGLDTGWDGIARLLEQVASLRGLLARFAAREPEAADAVRSRFLEMSREGRTLLADDAPAGRHRTAFVESQAVLASKQALAEETFALDPVLAWGRGDEASWAARIRSTAQAWLQHKASLRSWSGWVRTRIALTESGLEPLRSAVESGKLTRAALGPAFERSFYSWWIEALFEAEPVLRRFRGPEQLAKIADFRQLDGEVMDVTQEVVRAELGESLPSGRAAAESRSSSSEMGILHRELMKRRNMPIRRLFERIPNVLARLKPCMLMSPLSVAQYLGPDFPTFDLVVFDEASQIPPWDAVGAIARGTKLVVVGDSKQLPPTNFFNRSQEGDEIDDEDDLREMESILDECIAARLPRLHLGWHYRSRHESLIAFSNHHYYEDRLYTFPSALQTSPDLGVSWHHVPDGVYDKGRTRTNRGEAEALVAELVRRLLDPEESKRTYGVVTFSIAQQGLVEDLLEQARREHPEIEASFDDALEEPVFVKNLENVQGDERDVILMSVCYGPDEQGRVSLNFGPLNREGGERRLNVAVTRSREQVMVFSALRSDQIDLSRTQAQGARHLKGFLEYAEFGTAALGQAVEGGGGRARPSAFEESIRETLVARGWSVESRVGCSAYRIDLGVKDPDVEGSFLTAVEGDGAMYGNAATARDRHGTRPFMLKRLGWEHYRAWSTDWWQDPEGEAEKLQKALDDALAQRRAQRAVAEARAAELAAAEAAGEAPADGEPAGDAPTNDRPADGEPDDAETTDSEPAPREGIAGNAAAAPSSRAGTQEPLGVQLGGEPYRKVSLERRSAEPKEFYTSRADAMIVRRIEKVIEAEAPVALGVIARRLADVWGLKSITTRLQDRVGGLVSQARGWRFGPDSARFFWRRDQDPASFGAFRVPGRGAKPERRARHIPPQEVANAAEVLLQEHVGIEAAELARETARLFGYRRITDKVRTPMEAGVRLLVQRGGAVQDGDTVRLP